MGITHYILFFYESICYILKCLPCHTLILGRPSNLQILIYYILLGVWLLIHKKCSAHWHYLIFVLAVGILCYCPSTKVSGLEMTNLDVGQGGTASQIVYSCRPFCGCGAAQLCQ